jgi:hypothetical protein
MQHQESAGAARLVVGLFHSGGIAEDAVHRLVTEGVAPRDIAYRVLREAAPIPPTSVPELAALDVDPLVVGNARESFARFIRDGETAVFVRALSDEQVEFATGVLRLYLPITVEVVSFREGTPRPPP